MSDEGHVRASDAERDGAALELRQHFADGRITEQELSDRLEAVYASSTRGELEQIRHDLPAAPPSPRERREQLAERQAELRGRLAQQAGGSFVPFVICVVIWAASGASGPFWPAFALIAPLLFVGRNLWLLHGPAPDLERVEAELARGAHRRQRELRREARGR